MEELIRIWLESDPEISFEEFIDTVNNETVTIELTDD